MNTTVSTDATAPLPPYVYGRECGPNEKVWTEDGVRAAQRAAVAQARDTAIAVQTVDTVLVGLFGRELKVALVPLADADGRLLLPGGIVHLDKDHDALSALNRVLTAQLGFIPRYIEQSFTVAGVNRGTGGWTSSIVHLALHPSEDLQALADAGKIQLVTVLPGQGLPPSIAFDHSELIAEAIRRFSIKASNTSIVSHLLAEVFTLSDLHRAFEVATQRTCNPANFRRKILESKVLVGAETLHGSGRPAQGYRFENDIVHFDKQIV